MASAVSLKHVVKSYRRGREKVEVLHALDLDIPEGEFLALMGPSGSGKTTILNLIGGLDRADSGEVIVAGENLRIAVRWPAAPMAHPPCRLYFSSSTI